MMVLLSLVFLAAAAATVAASPQPTACLSFLPSSMPVEAESVAAKQLPQFRHDLTEAVRWAGYQPSTSACDKDVIQFIVIRKYLRSIETNEAIVTIDVAIKQHGQVLDGGSHEEATIDSKGMAPAYSLLTLRTVLDTAFWLKTHGPPRDIR